MNIVLLLFGQPRFVNNQKVVESYNKLFNEHNVKIFGHLWWSEDEKNYQTSTWSTINGCPVLPNTKEIIDNLYPNNKIIYQKSEDFEIPEFLKKRFSNLSSIFTEKNLKNVISHLYSFEQSSKLIDTETLNNCDLIIVGRTDSEILYLPDLNELSTDKFYLSQHHNQFPDLMFIFGKKYLNFMKTFTSLNDTMTKVWQPSAEAFKHETFKLFYDENNLTPIKLDINIVREF